MELTVEKFKNIERIQLSVTGLSLLVGGNNAGKTSVLQAIQFGVSVAQTSSLQGGFWVDERLSTSIGQSELVYSPIKDVLSLARNGRLREAEADAIKITYKDGTNECKVSVRKGRNKNILLEIIGKTLGEQLQSISNPICALVTGLAGIPSEEEFETNVVVRKAAAMGDSNGVFRNILLQLKAHPVRWEKFRQQIERIFPGYVVDVNFNPDIDEFINCSVTKAGVVYPIDSCGTGLLQAIQIFSYINLFNPKLLLLDEPDSHLHPNNQKQLAHEIIEVSQGGLNVIVSTHSKHLVEALIDHSNLVWLSNGAKQPDAENYEVRALLEIGALNVGERIGNPAHIFLTEDAGQQTLEILLESNGYDLDECEIVSYSGCTQIGTALALICHLQKRYPNARYALHRDRDFLEQAELDVYASRFQSRGIKIFFPDGNDIESHLARVEHISITCNIPEEMAREVLQNAFNARKEEMIAKYVNTKVENARRKGDRPNAGEISVECLNALIGPMPPAVHGKILLKGVRDELVSRGIQDRLVSTSAALANPRLVGLFD